MNESSFFRRKTATFLKGLFALLPILLSFYLVYIFIYSVEDLASKALLLFLPHAAYYPGIGVLAVIILVYLFGRLLENKQFRWGFEKIETSLQIMPLVKTVYSSIKDLTSYLAPGAKAERKKVVLVKWPGADLQMMGLVTREDFADLANKIPVKDRVAVFFPFSYALGGYTVFIPQEWVQPVNMGVEEAMKSMLTAWMPSREKQWNE